MQKVDWGRALPLLGARLMSRLLEKFELMPSPLALTLSLILLMS